MKGRKDKSTKTISVKKIMDLLNGLLAIDPDAINDLFLSRVRCGEAMANHPTAQVAAFRGRPGYYEVGPLGILNGLFGPFEGDDWEGILAEMEDDRIVRFTHRSSLGIAGLPGDAPATSDQVVACVDR